MRPLTSRGVTLVELLAGLVVLALFAAVVVSLVRGTGGAASHAAESLAVHRTQLSLGAFLQQELRDGAGDDVALLTPVSVAMQRRVGEAMTCGDSAGALLIADSAWHGTRAPQGARDIALLLIDSTATTWLQLPIDSVAVDHCPIDGAAAMRLRVAAHGGRAVLARVLEPVELSVYRSGASDWLGLTPASHASAVQPFAGPLLAGVSRFSLTPARLDLLLAPAGSTAVTVQLPLATP